MAQESNRAAGRESAEKVILQAGACVRRKRKMVHFTSRPRLSARDVHTRVLPVQTQRKSASRYFVVYFGL